VLPLVLVALLALAGPAAAHTSLVSTDPGDGTTVDAAPEQVVLTFSENLREPSEASLMVDGDAVDADVVVDGPRLVVTAAQPAEGAHELNYRVVSADGHPVTGTTTFTVRASGAAPAVEPTASEPTVPAQSSEPATTGSGDEPADTDTDADSGGTPVWLWIVLGAVVVLGLGAVAVVRARAGSRDDRS
jgi:hypothetical protein